MPRYIQLPVEASSQDLLQLATKYLQARVPGWRPSDGELDYIMLQTQALLAAELATLASNVPAAIFRWFGATMMNLPPEEASLASVQSTWTAIDNLGHTIPVGAQVAILGTGDVSIGFQVVNEVIIPPGSTATAAGAVALLATEPGAAGSGLGGDGIEAMLIDPYDWVDSVVLTAATTGGVDSELDDAYLDRLRAELQLMTPRPILPEDFATLARQVAGVYRATAVDGYNPLHNLLDANEASIETDITGWANFANTTLAQTGSQSADGTKSAQMTAQGAADMQARTVTGKTVTFNQRITGGVSVRANSTVRQCKAVLHFLDAGNNLVGSAVDGTASNDSSSTWTEYTVTGTAPEGATQVRLVVFVAGAAGSEVHYFDKGFLRKNSLTAWSPGGTPEYSNERYVAVALQDSGGGAAGPTVKAEAQAMLQSEREVNFVIEMIDPTFSVINVVWEVEAYPGVDLAALLASINGAIDNFLDPLSWGLPDDGDPRVWVNRTTLRYLDLAHIVKSVVGVDYIKTLVFAIDPSSLDDVDIELPGVAPLPQVGTIAGTIT